MSWDVMVLNYHGSPPADLASLPKDHRPEPLGQASEVRASIDKSLPGVDWSDPTWGMYMGNGFTFEFNVGREDPVDAIMVHVRGGGDAIGSLLKFAVPNKWSLLDCSTSEFIDSSNPSQEGWEGFQAFRDRAIRQYRERN